MLSAPGLNERAESITRHPVVAGRSVQHTLSLAGTAWLDHISDPTALASFTLMLAAGLLVALVFARPAKTQTTSLGRIARKPLLFILAIQLPLLPLLWSHHSDYPSILGRFSMGYFVVIAINAALLIGVALLLWQRRRIESILIRHAHIVPCAALAIILLLFTLTQIRIIHWRANTYLWASIHSLLVVLAWQLSLTCRSSTVARRFAVGIGSLYVIAWLGTAVVAFAVYFYSKEDILRTYTYLAHLNAWSGLIWGAFLGYLLNAVSGRHKWLKVGSLAAALWLGYTIVAGNLALLPKFQQYAREFDARHAHISELRQAGQRQFVFAPLSFDLPRYMSVAPFDTHHCPLFYYDIDEIDIEMR
ncbi:MAG: hypothetical protein OXF90_14285 [Chloroflexi bacterium]|nr:hypothetical protein [Chloroflexota bacterium]